MSNIMNIIFFVTMYPIVFLLYYIFKVEGKAKPHMLFGIRVSEEWLSKAENEALQEDYRHKMNRYLLIVALVPLLTLLIPYFSISFTIWMVWLLAAIVVFMLPYAMGNRKLKQIKQDRCVAVLNSGIIYTEIKQAGSVRTVKKTSFLLPNLLCIGMAVFSLFRLHEERFELYSILIITFASCTPLFYLCALWMDRIKTRVISTDSDVNVNYARAHKKLWKDFWSLCIWMNTLFTAGILIIALLKTFAYDFAVHVILWGSILYCILLLGECGHVWKKKVRLDKQYADKMDMEDGDDENFWIGGILYYNPNDTHTMVNKKMGIGTTTNMATPAGKALVLISMIAILSIPVCCVWMMLEEFTPISLTITDDTLVAEHWKTDYKIPVNTIKDVTLLETLPRTSKVNGTGMDNLKKGTFRTAADGKVQCFLNPQNGVFLRFTSGDTIYYISGYDDAETMEIYELLSGDVSL